MVKRVYLRSKFGSFLSHLSDNICKIDQIYNQTNNDLLRLSIKL